jgi:hypothetical protein
VRDGYCDHHAKLAGEIGEDAVRHGDYLRRRRRQGADVPVVAEVEVPPRLSDSDNRVSPSQVRSRLGELAAANLDELERTLLEAASSASRSTWATVVCKHCERPGRYEISVPDFKVRVDAAVRLLEQGLGRAPQAEDSPARVPETVEEVESLSWPQMQHLAGALLVDEIAALGRTAGRLSYVTGSPGSRTLSARYFALPLVRLHPNPESSVG